MAGDEPTATASPRPLATGLVLCRAATLVAIVASAALYVHYLNPADSGFCGLHSGCEEVRRSALSYFQSRFVSMPLVGLVAYASVFALSMARPEGGELAVVSGIGGFLALALVAVQAFYVGAFCWLCTVVDAAALVAAGSAVAHRRSTRSGELPFDPLTRGAWWSLFAVMLVAPFGWTAVKPAPPVPSVIRAEYEPGKINVIEFADFECPFCRKLHPLLKRVLADYSNVRFVRKQVPLEMHEQARPAARAAICAEAQGKGEALADRLVEIELSPAAIRRAAVGTGVDVPTFDGCLASTDPDRRIAADTKLLEEAGMEGLPTTYIGGSRLLGVVSEAALRDALDRAARNESPGGVPGPAYAAFGVALLAGVTWFGRARRGMVKDGR